MKSTQQQTDNSGLPNSLIGNIIDNRYKVERFLAAGNFGYVYATRHQILDYPLRQVALKLLKQPDINKDNIVDGMKDALVVAEISQRDPGNPYLEHIVHIYDIGISEALDNRGYIVMEYISNDLQNELKNQNGLPVNLAVDYAKQICRGVGLAHGQIIPVVHRDLKPANILISDNAVAKVTDFGIAKSVGFSSGSTEGAGDLMCQAPESLEGECTTRSDVYSLGLILYEMLTGEHPYASLYDELLVARDDLDKQFEIHKKARKKGLPGIREKAPLLRNHPELINVVESCCEYNPERRGFKDANELLSALEKDHKPVRKKIEKEEDPVIKLFNKADAAQKNDPEMALKFIEKLMKKAIPGKHHSFLGKAYYLKGKILAASKKRDSETVNQAQTAFFIAHRDYAHPLAADARRDFLNNIGR